MSRRSKQRRVRPQVRVSHCAATGKVRYPDGRAAVAALHGAATHRHFAEVDQRDSRRQECRHYECASCKGWHLTSSAQRLAQAA